MSNIFYWGTVRFTVRFTILLKNTNLLKGLIVKVQNIQNIQIQVVLDSPGYIYNNIQYTADYPPALQIGLSLLLISMVGIGLLASVTRGRINVMLTVLSPQLMATAALMPLIGYTFGYVLLYLFRLNGS